MGLRKTTHSRVFLSDKNKIKRLAKDKNLTEAQVINYLLNKKIK